MTVNMVFTASRLTFLCTSCVWYLHLYMLRQQEPAFIHLNMSGLRTSASNRLVNAVAGLLSDEMLYLYSSEAQWCCQTD